MTELRYRLNTIREDMSTIINNPNREEIEKDEKFVYKGWLNNGKTYHIIKYNKAKLNEEHILDNTLNFTRGLCRSIIFSNNKINVFSPPRSISLDSFENCFASNECLAEEFIEGTMINVFYDYDIEKWNIATKTSVGGDIKYFLEQPTFNKMFTEVCEYLQLDLNSLNREYIYSFVMQHPHNRFVLPIKEMRLYLIAVYKIDNLDVIEVPPDQYLMLNIDLNKFWYPYKFTFVSFQALKDHYGTMNADITYAGIVIRHNSGVRTKIRNPSYTYIKFLRGNNTKLQYQYLALRKSNRVKEYLLYYPEAKKLFTQFRTQLHDLTDTLYSNYVNCYIKKEKPLREYPAQFRSHMYNLHKQYLAIKQENGYIHRYSVISYINSLEPAQLMYTLNYSLRKSNMQIDVN